ncbi:hypothetical protein PspS49_17750 [Pseudomonas sp. S49]|nr:hypothetical protein PspS49_17750 [Pseudomonas sp. S49]
MWSTQNPVGASLLAKTLAQSESVLPDTPLSRAGSLPQWAAAFPGYVVNAKPCGSEPAREGVGTVCICIA